jgi:hypothetical protein
VKDDACTVRDIQLPGSHVVDVPGFVRLLESYEDDRHFCPARLCLLVLCDADPIVWRLRFEVVTIDGPAVPCLTGLTYVGRWHAHGAAVFMHPPTRAGDVPWTPGRADMTLVEPER